MRSKLFVPASRPERFDKALLSGADAICIDLEDSVLPSQRVAACVSVKQFLGRLQSPRTGAIITVRVNRAGSADLMDDLTTVVHPQISTIVLTKVQDAEQVSSVAERIKHLEDERRIAPIALLPTIESPGGLRNALAIAGATPRVLGLQMGFADLLLPLGIASDYSSARDYARWMLRLAAGEAAVDCYEAAYLNFKDLAGFRAELLRAKAMGFSGASCIHPSQVSVANEIFQPTAKELEAAEACVRAADSAGADGQGAASTAAGDMVDMPVLEAAKRLLARYRPT